jgi:Integrase core domain
MPVDGSVCGAGVIGVVDVVLVEQCDVCGQCAGHYVVGTALGDPEELDRLELQSAVFEYVEAFYNRERRHSTVGMHSPVAYEQLRLSPLGG